MKTIFVIYIGLLIAIRDRGSQAASDGPYVITAEDQTPKSSLTEPISLLSSVTDTPVTSDLTTTDNNNLKESSIQPSHNGIRNSTSTSNAIYQNNSTKFEKGSSSQNEISKGRRENITMTPENLTTRVSSESWSLKGTTLPSVQTENRADTNFTANVTTGYLNTTPKITQSPIEFTDNPSTLIASSESNSATYPSTIYLSKIKSTIAPITTTANITTSDTYSNGNEIPTGRNSFFKTTTEIYSTETVVTTQAHPVAHPSTIKVNSTTNHTMDKMPTLNVTEVNANSTISVTSETTTETNFNEYQYRKPATSSSTTGVQSHSTESTTRIISNDGVKPTIPTDQLSISTMIPTTLPTVPTSSSTTPTSVSTSTTVTPSTSTTVTPSTSTTVTPSTSTTVTPSTSTAVTPSTTTSSPSTITPSTPTLPTTTSTAPATNAPPPDSYDRHFDTLSFFGGITLAASLIGICIIFANYRRSKRYGRLLRHHDDVAC